MEEGEGGRAREKTVPSSCWQQNTVCGRDASAIVEIVQHLCESVVEKFVWCIQRLIRPRTFKYVTPFLLLPLSFSLFLFCFIKE